MVQTCILHSDKICFRYPGLPMICEDSQSGVVVLHLTESVFVDNIIVVRVLENAGCDPGL